MTIQTRDVWHLVPEAVLASGGPNTSIALAGTQDVADGDTDAVVFDTTEASANLVAGVPTVPADGDYWVNASALAAGAGVTGSVKITVTGSTSGTILADELAAGPAGVVGTLGKIRRKALVAGETLSVTIQNSTGATVTIGSSVTATFLQFWAA